MTEPDESARLLLVDDEEAFVNVLIKRLAKRHIQATPAFSGVEALQRLRHNDFEVAIVDLKMNGMDGLEVIGRLRSRPELRRLPIVVLTGATLDPPRREQLERFGVPAAGKPCKIAELIDLLSDTALGKQYLSG